MSVSRSPSRERLSKRKRRSATPTREDDPPPSRRRASLSPPGRVGHERRDRLADHVKSSIPKIQDHDPARRREREDQLRIRLAEQELAGVVKPKPDPKLEMQKMAATRGGGAYIPPARLKAMLAELDLEDPSSPEYQRMRWDALRKSINGLINKVNVGNIKFIVPELFAENLIRGRGLFARSIMRAQASSLPFTPVFAAVVSIINTKLPSVGELLVTRVVSQFRRAYRRNDKVTCVATSVFIAQLVNQQVSHHLLAFEMIILLLEKPTDDSVEVAVGFTKEVGAFLSEAEPKANNSVYERFRSILHEATISKRVQYMIEVLFQVRKDRFKDNPVLPEGLDLVEEDDVITHPIHLDDELQVQEGLNAFKFDPEFVETEEKYTAIKKEILGDDSDSSSGSESGSEGDSDDEEADTGIVNGKVDIHDHTGTNLINFRRNVYLTIMSSLDFEEAAHKLLKKDIEEGLELELANMVVECCSQERSFAKFYGLLGERFCKLNQTWTMTFDQCFRNYYDTIHRFETNRLRNIARFFGHLLAQDAVPWTVFEVIKMNEDDTTSSSRIFVKIMFQELSEVLGLKALAERLKDPSMKVWTSGLFPVDNPKNTRFSINFFTSIGLGILTEEMREHLKRAPQLIMAQRRKLEDAVDSSSDDSSSDTSSLSSTTDLSSSDSDDESPPRRGGRRISPGGESPVRRGGRHNDSDDRSLPRRGGRRSSPNGEPPFRRRAYRNDPGDDPPRRRGGRRSDSDGEPPSRRRAWAADDFDAEPCARRKDHDDLSGQRPSPRRREFRGEYSEDERPYRRGEGRHDPYRNELLPPRHRERHENSPDEPPSRRRERRGPSEVQMSSSKHRERPVDYSDDERSFRRRSRRDFSDGVLPPPKRRERSDDSSDELHTRPRRRDRREPSDDERPLRRRERRSYNSDNEQPFRPRERRSNHSNNTEPPSSRWERRHDYPDSELPPRRRGGHDEYSDDEPPPWRSEYRK